MKTFTSRSTFITAMTTACLVAGNFVSPWLSVRARAKEINQRSIATAADLTVTNTNNSGAGSLRQAVADSITAGGGNITFSSLFNTPQTINLTTGGFAITTAVTINITGTGADLVNIQNTQVQHPTSTIFQINNGATVNLKGVTLSGGNTDGTGGGILLLGTSVLTIDECSISHNNAQDSGGGIATGPNTTTTITNSTIYNNISHADFGGGGIDNEGTLTIINSTISKNAIYGTMGRNAGGVFEGGPGPATIISSTITDNYTAGPNTGSTGGIFNGGSVTLKNSIVAANFLDDGIPDTTGFGNINSGGFNLIGNPGSMTSFTQPGDQTGTPNHALDPKLASISTNGGHTLTLRPLAGSPAIDKGKSFGSVRDQRGSVRPVGNPATSGSDGSDIGSVEVSVRSTFDFDGDNKSDLSIFRPTGTSGAEWWISRSNLGNVFATVFGISTDVPVPADFTGDQRCDIAVFRPSTGQWYVLGSEDFSFYAFPFGTSGDIPAPADFDGDGKADAAVFRPSSGTWFIARSSNGQIDILQFGSAGDRPEPADYDGDGKADPAVFRPSGAVAGAAEWWIQRSTLGLLAFQFGSSTDKAVPGDYTGDSRVDCAFYRPGTGQWYVLRSEDFSYYSFPFGTTGDIPAPGDYDGDNKTDAAVFRPTTGTWYLNRSSSGVLVTPFGTNGDVPAPSSYVR